MTDEPSILDTIHLVARPFTTLDAEKLLTGKQDGRDCFWGAVQRGAPTLIGTVVTHMTGSDEIEIGYWFVSAVRGSGLAPEALMAIATALRSVFPARRVVAE